MSAIDPPRPALSPVRKARRFPTLRAISALILREMVTTYGRSPGGYLWALVEPAAGIALLTIIFSLGFRSPPLGTNFPIFYATGIVPFQIVLGLAGLLGSSINYSRALLAYPAVTFVDALLARFILNGLTQLMVAYVIFSGILIAFDTHTTLDLDTIALAFAMSLALAAGVGTMNCLLFSVFPVWQRVWGIVTRPLFLISGILFIFDAIPQPYRDYLWWNPLIHVVGMMRSAFYARYDAAYASPLYIFLLSGVLLVVSLLFLYRYHRDILNN